MWIHKRSQIAKAILKRTTTTKNREHHINDTELCYKTVIIKIYGTVIKIDNKPMAQNQEPRNKTIQSANICQGCQE